MCCAGCEAVARTIVAGGLETYYETRDLPAAAESAPAALPPAEIYDDPLAQKQFVTPLGPFEREAMLVLDRIRCAACVWLNEQVLRTLPGVTRVSINYTTRRAQIAWDARAVRLGEIITTIRGLGYDAFPFDPARRQLDDRTEKRAALWRLFVAGFGAMQVMMYAIPRYVDDSGTLSAESDQILRWASLVLTLPVMAFSCGPFFASAWADLRGRRLGIDVPVSLGIVAGFAASAWATITGGGAVYFDSITMLVFLLLGARYLELGARQTAAGQLDRLARWMPALALRLRSPGDIAGAEKVAAHELRAGDWVLVAPGETIPADGLVERGAGSADESLLTGESRPVEKHEGSPLIGGSVNLDQRLTMRVTHAGTETRAAAIGRLIERAAAGKPRLMQSADRIARALTSIVLVCAAAAFLGWGLVDASRAFWITIAVLMVTCPCALGLAAPIALTSATGALASRGVIATRAQAIESLTAVTDVVFDKTGTLTEGRLRVLAFDLLGPVQGDEVLAIVSALETGNRHPIARALSAYSGAARSVRAESQTHYPGGGIEALIEGHRMRIGSAAFCCVTGATRAAGDALEETAIFLTRERVPLARFLLEDTLRPDAAELVDGLCAQGMKIHLLSGDAPGVVAAVARGLGIDAVRSGASPQDKHAYVRDLQSRGHRVAMVGDGLNDAPVLAQADVSVAMGEGAALAQIHADLVLLSGRLGSLLAARQIAAGTMRVIRQNFGWALAYNAIALPLAVAGLIGPWEAAIGMTASSLVVVLNSARFTARLR